MDNIKINYLELPAKDLQVAKQFFSQVFGWDFVDYGPEYTAFKNAGIEGGFYRSNLASTTINGSVLVVLYVKSLKYIKDKICQKNGKIIKDTFSFPGGYRFHFADPNGNEFAVWSGKDT